jgi:muramoyltetrapeptide carboxypeptidase LdcA involved in peptidoglycan recycling
MRAKLGVNVYADDGIGISSTPEKCAAEFMDMYLNKEADVLVSCGGGELMCEILPFLDFETLKYADAKWFMGYSDNTNITFLLTTLADTASIYGPCAASFGMEPWHPAVEDAFLLLTGQKYRMTNYPFWERESLKDEEHPLAPYHVTEPFHLRTNIQKSEFKVSGRLLGGCLDCLSNLVGTRFDRVKEFGEKYKDDGILWFLECCDLNVMDMRRSLWNLREAGWFKHARGFLIGRPMHYDMPMMGLDQYEAVTGVLSDLDVPVIMDLDIGHTAPMMPIVCGACATAAVKNGSFELDMQLKKSV